MGQQATIAEDESRVGEQIETGLLAALRAAAPQAENTSFTLSARNPEGTLVGGLTASTSYGWLLIKTLWVDAAHRCHGLGRALMDRAEAKGVAIGCHGAWLDTSSPDAMQFYTKLGYAPFGELANTAGQHPPAHRRWFMCKAL